MEAIRSALYGILAENHPMTVRQVFYAATTAGEIAKTEREYKQTICRLLADMRRSREIPYTWLADSTRWMRRPQTFSSLESALKRTADTYRRALWDDASVAVEVWLEKEALAGVLVDVTDRWDVPLMVTRGYPSMSFLYSAAMAIQDRASFGQRTQLYYFGDHDPSGRDIDRAVVDGINECLSGSFAAYASFERVAVTEEQIADWHLPTRPTKKSDSRSKHFEGESVEVDAIPPARLRALAERCIELHVDRVQLSQLRTVEDEERRVLYEIADRTTAA